MELGCKYTPENNFLIIFFTLYCFESLNEILTECAQTRPDDPLAFIAQKLEKYKELI